MLTSISWWNRRPVIRRLLPFCLQLLLPQRRTLPQRRSAARCRSPSGSPLPHVALPRCRMRCLPRSFATICVKPNKIVSSCSRDDEAVPKQNSNSVNREWARGTTQTRRRVIAVRGELQPNMMRQSGRQQGATGEGLWCNTEMLKYRIFCSWEEILF